MRAARRLQAQLAWAAACDDARHLAVELAAGRPAQPLDVMRLGIVIEPEETAYRIVAATISQYDKRAGQWPIPTPVAVLITNRRLIARLPHGVVISFWWATVIALDVDLVAGRVVLDHGDNEPRSICSGAIADIAVASISGVYGTNGLLRHPALDLVRASVTELSDART